LSNVDWLAVFPKDECIKV